MAATNKKLKNYYVVYFFLKKQYIWGCQYVRGNSCKHAMKRFKQRFPSKKLRSHLTIGRYYGIPDNIHTQSAI